MKFLKYLILGLLFLFLGAIAYGYYLLKQQQPTYTEKNTFSALAEQVDVKYDTYGIPHIYAQNEEDAFKALGYVHAKDRLFQMELIRRIGRGRLAEILGTELVKTDQLFRTLGVENKAKASAKEFLLPAKHDYQKAALAYVDGINHFIQTGPSPIEFTILNIPKTPFEAHDLYLTIAYMSFGFAEGFRTDPIINKIQAELGHDYMKDIAIDWPKNATTIPIKKPSLISPDSLSISQVFEQVATEINQIVEDLPVPLLAGSNSWIVDGTKTTTGLPILCNDTHIGYGQPAVWYEAHLEYPNKSIYGNFLAGYPFPPLGHTPNMAIGLTMLENDDVDFYKERLNTNDSTQIWVNDHWEKMEITEESIPVKGEEEILLQIKKGRHGPLVSGLFEEFNKEEAISIYWTFLKTPCRLLEASYEIINATKPEDVEKAVSLISAPGLNVMYADKQNNIAWFTAGHLIKRPTHVVSAFLLDGTTGKDEPLGFYDSHFNPKNINPSTHYLYSANNQPDSTTGNFYPGYYVPENRAKRILHLLDSKEKWSIEDMQQFILDDKSSVHAQIAQNIITPISQTIKKTQVRSFNDALQTLEKWDGNHHINSHAPTIYNKLLQYIFKYTMEDEIGEEALATFQKTFTFRRSIDQFISNEQSKWWDNVNTPNKVETRAMIFEKAFRHTVRDLKSTLANDWAWGNVHTLEHKHPIGRQKPFNLLFNVGPFPVAGGNAVINNQGFFADTTGNYEVIYGPAMRKIIGLHDLQNTWSVLPTGQSGNVMSPFYNDQAELFIEGKFRPQLMHQDSISKYQTHQLTLSPQ